MNQFLIVNFRRAYKAGFSIGSYDFAAYQTVVAKPVDSLEVSALEVQVRIANELTIDDLCVEGVEMLQNKFVALSVSWRSRETGEQELARLDETDRKFSSALNIGAGTVAWGANETEVVLPAQRRHHMFRREVRLAVFISRANQHQRRYCKKTVPNRPARIDSSQCIVVGCQVTLPITSHTHYVKSAGTLIK